MTVKILPRIFPHVLPYSVVCLPSLQLKKFGKKFRAMIHTHGMYMAMSGSKLV